MLSCNLSLRGRSVLSLSYPAQVFQVFPQCLEDARSEATAHAGMTRASLVKFTRECIHVPGTEVPEHASQPDAAFARSALVCCRITRELRHCRPKTPSSSTLLVGRGRSCRNAVIGRLWSYHNHKRYRNHRSRARVSKRFSTGLAT
jgi:hypothetical protein